MTDDSEEYDAEDDAEDDDEYGDEGDEDVSVDEELQAAVDKELGFIRDMKLDPNDEANFDNDMKEVWENLEKELDDAMINAGLIDKQGQLDPVLRAAITQCLINVSEDATYEYYKNEANEVELDEDLEEDWLQPALNEELQDEINQETVKHQTGTKFAHPISDLSDQEDKNDPKAVMADFWETIDANTDFYLKNRVQDILTPKINRDYLRAKMRRNYRTKWL